MLDDATFSATFNSLSRGTSVLPGALGAYFWGGLDVPNALVPGLKHLQENGFPSTARILLAQREVRNMYRFDAQWEAEVPPGQPFLPRAIKSTQYKKAFALPGLLTIVFSAVDSASQDHREDPEWLRVETNAELVRKEYRDMTVALYKTPNVNGKRFIVGNWESDSEIFGGDPPPEPEVSRKRLRFLKRWFQLRQEGIRQGRDIAASEGLSGIEVNDGIEFTSIYFQKEYQRCSEIVGDALHDIVIHVKPDYTSYSAWQSSDRGRLYEDLIDVKKLLNRETNGRTKLIIGELGVPYHSRFSLSPSLENLQSKAWRFAQLAHAAIRAEIPVIILWKAWDNFDPYVGEGNGLLNADGSARPALNYIRTTFKVQPVEAIPDPINTTRISGVNDQFDMLGLRNPDRRRYFEVYGNFPECNPGNFSDPQWVGKYWAILNFADGQMIRAHTTGESLGQVNFAVRPSDNVRWFSLRVRHEDFKEYLMRLTSNEVGPIRLNPIPPETSDCKSKVNNRYWDFWVR